MQTTLRWTPDTCGCVLLYTYDSDDPEETRAHTPIASEKVCPAHESLAGLSVAAVYAQVGKETAARSHAWFTAAEALAAQFAGKNMDANFTWMLSGDGLNRTLTISFPGVQLSNAQKNAIRNALANNPRVPINVTVL